MKTQEEREKEAIDELLNACAGVPYLATMIYELLCRNGLTVIKKEPEV